MSYVFLQQKGWFLDFIWLSLMLSNIDGLVILPEPLAMFQLWVVVLGVQHWSTIHFGKKMLVKQSI
jgi:hypothetical protein